MNTDSKKSTQLLYFKVQDIRLCIQLNSIEKVLPLMLMETVPNSQPYFAGLANIAGNSTPIIDLTLFLKLSRTCSYDLDTPILLTAINSKKIGLIVDDILGHMTIDENSFQMKEEFHQKNSFFKATVPISNELFLLLNVEEIFNNYFNKEA